MSNPSFLWINQHQWQRNTHVYFRREFELDSLPESAEFNVFAHTHYHLKVNGVTVGVGPARSYPEFPEYDTYDIAPYLNAGKNAIAVRVAHMGYMTFHHHNVEGCFIGWGSVSDTDLATPDGWKCLESKGYDPWTERFSFAVGATDIFDSRKDPADWALPECTEGNWMEPVVLENPPVGDLLPRSIPHLTNDEYLPEVLLSSHLHKQTEDIVSFKMFSDFKGQGNRGSTLTAFAFTYIYSPEKQSLNCGVFWGEHFLNGAELEKEAERPEQFARNDVTLNLEEGWNFFFVYYGMDMDTWTFHIAVPSDSGLVFSPDKDMDSDVQFMIAGPFEEEEAASIKEQSPPDSPESIEKLGNAWRKAEACDVPASPQRGLAWALFEEDQGLPKHCVTDLEVPAGRDTSFIFDLGRMRLGRVFVELDGPEGTVIDVGHAERLKNGRPHHYLNFKVNAGERFIAREGFCRFETTHARGFRYLQVTVRNNDGPVTLKRAGIVSQMYPYNQNGSFECSDEALNALWEYGWYTCRLCSEDVITDTPWRERTLYGGDLYPEAATTFIGSGDTRLVKRCVDIFLQSFSRETHWLQSRAPEPRAGQPLYEYPLIVLVIADWIIRLDSDADFAQHCYPVFAKMMKKMEDLREDDGLFKAGRVFIAHSYKRPEGRQSTINALISTVFDSWANICEFAGEKDEAEKAREKAAQMAELVNKKFWDDDKKGFADALDESDGKVWSPGVYANAWTLMFGRPEPEQVEGAVEMIKTAMTKFKAEFGVKGGAESESVSTYNAFYLLGALYKYGYEGLAEQYIRVIYQLMLTHPTGTIWEHTGTGGSLSHAWSTAHNYYLSTRTLGVRLGIPETEGIDNVVIAPQADTVTWARGTVPHPQGNILVDWKVEGDILFLSYWAPEDVEVTVRPEGKLADCKLVIDAM